jgi:dienelactone hydrolase
MAGNGGWFLGRPERARRTPVAHEDRGDRAGRSEDRPHPAAQEAVRITVNGVALDGDLARPPGSGGIVLFAHGSGSSRHSPRNRRVAEDLQRAGLGTLLLDLLTAEEEQLDLRSRELRFDIGLLARRLVGAVDWLAARFGGELRVGLFGASTGAAAALVAAAERPSRVGGVVSRGGRPDLAGPALERVTAPTLLIVGGADPQVLTLNRQAAGRLGVPHRLEVVPGAGHLFEEPGALEEVARLAGAWFVTHLQPMSADPSVG